MVQVDREGAYSIVVGHVGDQTADGLGRAGLLVDITVDRSGGVEVALVPSR